MLRLVLFGNNNTGNIGKVRELVILLAVSSSIRKKS